MPTIDHSSEDFAAMVRAIDMAVTCKHERLRDKSLLRLPDVERERNALIDLLANDYARLINPTGLFPVTITLLFQEGIMVHLSITGAVPSHHHTEAVSEAIAAVMAAHGCTAYAYATEILAVEEGDVTSITDQMQPNGLLLHMRSMGQDGLTAMLDIDRQDGRAVAFHWERKVLEGKVEAFGFDLLERSTKLLHTRPDIIEIIRGGKPN